MKKIFITSLAVALLFTLPFALVLPRSMLQAGAALTGDNWPSVNKAITNPVTSTDPNNAYQARFTATVDNSTVNPTFANVIPFQTVVNTINGLNQYDARAKTTFAIWADGMENRAAGQRFGHSMNMNNYGMGDAFGTSHNIYWGGGVGAGGDEGQGWMDVTCGQQHNLVRTTIAAIPAASTINTTLTTAITASKTAQQLTVGSTVGLAAGQWVTMDPQAAGSAQAIEANMECVKAISVDDGTHFTAICWRNHAAGVAILPATVLKLNTSDQLGQQRWLVNLTQPSYAVGTACGNAGKTSFTGVGTNWTANMVGGSPTNIGMISFAADDYAGTPFGPGDARLRDWYPISSITDATDGFLLHRSTVGIDSYGGQATTQGAYEIRPGARIMNFDGVSKYTNVCVLPYNTFTWAVGDTVECTLSPDIDYSGLILRSQFYSAGGRYGRAMLLVNSGAKPLQTGLDLYDSFGGRQGPAYNVGLNLGSRMGTGIHLGGNYDQQAILLGNRNAHIVWQNPGNAGLYFNPANNTLEILGYGSGNVVGTMQRGKISFPPGTAYPQTQMLAQFSDPKFQGESGNNVGLSLHLAATGSPSADQWTWYIDPASHTMRLQVAPGGANNQTVWTVDTKGTLTVGQVKISKQDIWLPDLNVPGAGKFLRIRNGQLVLE